MEDDWRNREIKISEEYAWLRRVTRGAVLIAIGIFLGMIIYADPASRQAYVINVFTGVLSLGATALIFDELNRRRSERDYKRQLVDDAASTSNEIAKNAVHQLRRRGWLQDENGLLQGKDLKRTNLQGAYLSHANLQGAILRVANLQDTSLTGTNLQQADLSYANLSHSNLQEIPISNETNLQEADLTHTDLQLTKLWSPNLRGATLTEAELREVEWLNANLQDACLLNANLRGADLSKSKLQRADLTGANLQGAILTNVIFEGAVLPDGKPWKLETNMLHFIDPKHPDFWRSEDYMSPAWSGLNEN